MRHFSNKSLGKEPEQRCWHNLWSNLKHFFAYCYVSLQSLDFKPWQRKCPPSSNTLVAMWSPRIKYHGIPQIKHPPLISESDHTG